MPMLATSKASSEPGFALDPANAVAAPDDVEGVVLDVLDVVRGGDTCAQMIAPDRDGPRALDTRFATVKTALIDAVRDHSAL